MATLYTPPKLSAAARRAHDKGEFDFLVPVSKNLLRTDEVAEIINRQTGYIRSLIEEGRLEAHRDSTFGTRKSNIVTRRSVILYLAETAAYDPAYAVIRTEALMKTLRPEHLHRLAQTAARLANQIS